MYTKLYPLTFVYLYAKSKIKYTDRAPKMDILKTVEEVMDEMSILVLESNTFEEADELLAARRKVELVYSASAKTKPTKLDNELLSEAMFIVFEHSISALAKGTAEKAQKLSDIYNALNEFYQYTVKGAEDVHAH